MDILPSATAGAPACATSCCELPDELRVPKWRPLKLAPQGFSPCAPICAFGAAGLFALRTEQHPQSPILLRIFSMLRWRLSKGSISPLSRSTAYHCTPA